MIAIVPLIFAIIGLLMYLLCTTNVKAAEIGRIVFFCGFLVTMFLSGAHQVKLF